MASQELDYLITKLKEIQKGLGGPSGEMSSRKELDEFNKIKVALTDEISFITKKQEERDQAMNRDGRTISVIRANIEIKDHLEEAQNQLLHMNETLRRQKKNPKKYPEAQIEVKEQHYENCKRMIDHFKIKEEGDEIAPQEKIVTLTELKNQLAGDRPQNSTYIGRDLTQDETDALQAFKEKDKELEEMLTKINEGLTTLKDKAEAMGNAIVTHEILIDGLHGQVDKTAADLETANVKLRKVLYQYRKPSQFCMDVVCLLILMGLIAVIIKLATQ